MPHDGLISEEAKGRWLRWQQDLEAVELKEAQQCPARYERHKAFIRRPVSVNPTHLLSSPSSIRPASSLSSSLGDTRLRDSGNSSPVGSSNTLILPPRARDTGYMDGIMSQTRKSSPIPDSASLEASRFLGPNMDVETTPPSVAMDIHYANMDQISDTVGAIAVDSHGNIAAGSSSGGIGMKHSGRIGPAALVGIGTAVIPVDPNDPDQICVATVTSGTGEHIATSMAAGTCASRIYYNQRKCEDGSFEEVTEDEALRGMIASEFMGNGWTLYPPSIYRRLTPFCLGHPGVKDSHCRGAIGIMAVKKTVDGVYLCFGHNTDSFVGSPGLSLSSYTKRYQLRHLLQ